MPVCLPIAYDEFVLAPGLICLRLHALPPGIWFTNNYVTYETGKHLVFSEIRYPASTRAQLRIMAHVCWSKYCSKSSIAINLETFTICAEDTRKTYLFNQPAIFLGVLTQPEYWKND
jgi:hypothetical protein